MRIGIDIDNTICSTTKVANKIYQKKYAGKNIYNLPKKDQYSFIQTYADDIFYNCPLEKNAKDVIYRLSKNNKIYLITARKSNYVSNIENITVDYLWDNNIKYNSIYFGQDSKLDIYKDLKLDIMIDDDYDVYEELIKNNYNAVMYDSYLNNGKIGNKVKTWDEFEALIERS